MSISFFPISRLRLLAMVPGLIIAPFQSRAASIVASTAAARVSVQQPKVGGQSDTPAPESPNYLQVQRRLARGWNTWDVHSVMTQVLLPDGLAIHIGLQQKTAD